IKQAISRVIFSGLFLPNANITVLEDGILFANIKTNKEAEFMLEFSDQDAGAHRFSFITEQGSYDYDLNVGLETGKEIKINNIFFPPTLNIDRQQLRQGSNLTISGQTMPNGKVVLFINSQSEIIKETWADKNGNWSYTFDTSVLEPGEHSIFVRALYSNKESNNSPAISFSVIAALPSADLSEDNNGKVDPQDSDLEQDLIKNDGVINGESDSNKDNPDNSVSVNDKVIKEGPFNNDQINDQDEVSNNLNTSTNNPVNTINTVDTGLAEVIKKEANDNQESAAKNFFLDSTFLSNGVNIFPHLSESERQRSLNGFSIMFLFSWLSILAALSLFLIFTIESFFLKYLKYHFKNIAKRVWRKK
ncbi:MAG: hypothetical protein MUF50_01425, partial [Planctomycetes bacterium]|nr:hypothetical protein [Planctomycetota bacterium]